MKKILFVFTLLIFSGSIKAQDAYTHALGMRGGPLIGVSYKRFMWPLNGVLEGIAGFNFLNGRYASFTGLYEHHLFINYQTNFFGGAGMTFGFSKETFTYQADAIVGIEYMLDTFPLEMSLDYKPAYRLTDGGKLILDEFALSIRFILD